MTDKWVVIGSDKCVWCSRVKVALDEREIDYTWFNISYDLSLYRFIKDGGFETVPQVFHNGKHIDGYEATVEHLRELAH